MTTPPDSEFRALLDRYHLKAVANFIPWSQSRNASERFPSLNWSVTVQQHDRAIVRSSYMLGCAHVPGYRYGDRSIDHAAMIRNACENGRTVEPHKSWRVGIIPFPTVDFFASLFMDAACVEGFVDYEQWAPELGYDPDSRAGERIFEECCRINRALRAVVGDDFNRAIELAQERDTA